MEYRERQKRGFLKVLEELWDDPIDNTDDNYHEPMMAFADSCLQACEESGPNLLSFVLLEGKEERRERAYRRLYEHE